MTTPKERILNTPLTVDGRARAVRVTVARDKYTVALISDGMNDRQEYAKLFAAAPKLWELLEAASVYIEEEVEQRKTSGNDEEWASLEYLSSRISAALSVMDRDAATILDGQGATFCDSDVPVTMKGEEWTALLMRLVRPGVMSGYAQGCYHEAAKKLREQLLTASERHPSRQATPAAVLDFTPR